MKRVCVFCGSNKGINPDYTESAQELGARLAQKKIELVYGGGHVGLMGVLADAVMKHGGKVIGIIPEALFAKEVGHKGITELRVVKTMHERKAMMADLSDAFIALPGGFGTYEEFFEVVTWSQLSIHTKPCALLNVRGYYDPLLQLVERGAHEGFIRQDHTKIVLASDSIDDLLLKLIAPQPILAEKWIKDSER